MKGYGSRIILSTLKDLQDTRIFPGVKGNGKFRIILQGRSTKKLTKMCGRIHILHKDFFDKFDQNKSIQKSIQKAKVLNDNKDDDNLYIRINNLYRKISLSLKEDNIASTINFSLDTHGFITLSLSNIGSMSMKEATETTLIEQAFYFIKYSLHQHQHHHHNDDNITKVHEGTLDKVSFKMIDDLKMALVEKKRERSEEANHYYLETTTGIVAYAKSLVESLLSRERIDTKEHSKQLNYFNNVNQSFISDYRNTDAKIKRKDSRHNSFRVWIMFFLAFTAPFLLIYRAPPSSLENENFIANFLFFTYSNPYIYLLLVILVVIFYTEIINEIGKSLAIKTLHAKYQKIFIFLKDSSKKYKVLAFGFLLAFGFFSLMLWLMVRN